MKKKGPTIARPGFFSFFFFFFFDIPQSLIIFLIAGNLTECVQVQLTWKLSRFFDTWREAQFFSPVPVMPSLKKRKEKKKTVHSTNGGWSWKISPSLCWKFRKWFAFQLYVFQLLSLVVTYSGQFTWQGHRKLQWAMRKDEPLLSRSNCPLETAESSRNYARVPGYKKGQEKDKKITEKWKA